MEKIMRIYNFPIKGYTPSKPETVFQPVDLDYIVSVGPVSSMSFTGGSCGESFAYFDIFIKIGQPIRITQPSGLYSEFPDYFLNDLRSERLKLIETWKGKES